MTKVLKFGTKEYTKFAKKKQKSFREKASEIESKRNMSNRPIKFRVWDKIKKEWFPLKNAMCLILNPESTDLCFVTKQGPYPIPQTGQKDGGLNRFVIQQFTGLTDSTGKEIYEGDVVLWHAEDHFEGGYSHKKMVVGWNQRCMQFRLFEFPNQVGKAAGETFWAEDVRVIGHIFDYENEECRYHLDESVKSLVKQL